MKFSLSLKLRNKFWIWVYKYLKNLSICCRFINYRHLKSKLRNLSIAKTFFLFFFSVCFYFFYKYLFPYDLMRIVLEEQKIYRFKVTCNISSLAKHYQVYIDNSTLLDNFKQFADVDKLTELKKLEIFRKYYLANQNNLPNKKLSYDLKLKNNFSSENEQINKFKICLFSPNERLRRKTFDEH